MKICVYKTRDDVWKWSLVKEEEVLFYTQNSWKNVHEAYSNAIENQQLFKNIEVVAVV